MDKLLEILEDNANLSYEQIAVMLDKEEGEIKDIIKKYEKDGVIVGYKTLIDWDKTDREYATALIEVKVVPQRDKGFDKVAEKIYRYPEVQSLYLMSGAYDFCVILEGKTMKEVAYFVAQKLSSLESVTGTATHFVLKKYKNNGAVYASDEVDPRGHCL